MQIPEVPTATLFGTLPDGRSVEAYRLTNRCGMSVTVLTYGGTLQAIDVPDARGERRNVALGFATLDGYLTGDHYFGAVIGRVASRIAGARFELDGTTYSLPPNDPPSSVHGGEKGFNTRLWAAQPSADPDSVAVRLEYVSADGEEGYPGTLATEVTYRLAAEENTLRFEYRATTDRPTVVNLTNHSYLNLLGEGSGSVLDHEVQLYADQYLPLDPQLIPTGELAPVAGTPLDFRTPHRIGERIRIGFAQLVVAQGYDHNYVVTHPAGLETSLVPAARVYEPVSGRTLEVWTTEPGLDVYTGNFLDGSLVGTGGATYRQSDGLAIEPEHFSNSPNTAHFPSVVLRPGEVYRSTTEFRFGAQQPGRRSTVDGTSSQ